MPNALRGLLLFAGLLFASAVNANAFTIQEVTSPGGIKAWLVEEHAIPLMAMNYSFKGGTELEPAGKEGVFNFLTGMLDEGAGDMLSAGFQKKRDELAFRMSFDAGSDFFEGSFQTITKNRDASADLLRLAITSPRFDAEPLERVRQQFLLDVKEKEKDPQSMAWQAWMDDILPGDPYSRPDEGTEATVSSITADDLKAAHRRIFNRDTLQVAVVGDITAKELGPLLDKVFGGLPETAPGQPELPEAKPAMGPKLRVIDRDMPQSVIVFGTEGIERDDKDFIPAFVMSEILGSGGLTSRLSEEIREKRGLTYGVSYGLSPMGRAGLYTGSLQTKNESAGEALDAAREVIRKYAEEGPGQKDLDDAKTFLTGSYALRFSSNSAIANQLLGIQQQNLGIDYVQKRNALVEAVTLDQVKAQARRLLHPDRLIVTVVGKPQGVK
ncbi:MAG: insulinase family protein [Aestuariivirga sp.]|uniref:M16 family metallopeptidase n=1 Tax=Aestuariivirga sp. TaxID=2650926 RepID=UPI0025B90496|nr:pitrilysin family protein [Aestuariivirga sp.]MCA3559694.1 insulinase family protein [Aestuariivirga sp.]